MKNKLLLLAVILFFSVETTMAQKGNYYQRALRMFEKENYEKAASCLQNNLQENPDDGASYELLGRIYTCCEEYDDAIESFNKALECTSKREKDALASIYHYRANAYTMMEEYEKAAEDYTASLRYDSDNVETYTDFGQMYLYTEDYEESANIYQKANEMDPENPVPYYGLASVALETGNTDEARAYISKINPSVIDESEEMSCFLIKLKSAEGDNAQALEFAIRVLRNNETNDFANDFIFDLSESDYKLVTRRLMKAKEEETEISDHLGFMLATIYLQKNPRKAIKTIEPYVYSESNYNIPALWVISEAYIQFGDYKSVLKFMNKAVELDRDDADFVFRRGEARLMTGDVKGSIRDFEQAMNMDEDLAYESYKQIALASLFLEQYDDALANIDKCLEIIPDDSYAHYFKGFVNLFFLENEAEAEKEFTACIDEESGVQQDSYKCIAYLVLDDSEKAEEEINSLLYWFPSAETYIKAAGFYGLQDETATAIEYLKKAMDEGFRNFAMLEHDISLLSIIQSEEYAQLKQQYEVSLDNNGDRDLSAVRGNGNKNKIKKNRGIKNEPKSPSANEGKVYEIPIKWRDGVYYIDTKVNGIPMEFIFDTGCSDVSLSSKEYDMMTQNGLLAEKDIIGQTSYLNATGEENEALGINIVSLQLGNLKVKNVSASVIPMQEAPLLLGMGVFNRFGKIEIDTKHKVVRIHVD